MTMTKNAIAYGEFTYVDAALSGVISRNHVMQWDAVPLSLNSSDCYVSMFRFPEAYREHVEQTKSVSGTDSLPHYSDYLWFDLDSPSDLSLSLGGANRLVEQVASIDSDLVDYMDVWFSGNKGFHIGIPAKLFGFEPSPHLARTCMALATNIAGPVEIDTSIYDHNRLWRVPNTRHVKSGLFKTPLSVEELGSRTVEQIKEKAKTRQDRPHLHIGRGSADDTNPKLVEKYAEVRKALQARPKRKAVTQKTTKSFLDRSCIRKLFSGVSEGQRNEASLRLACEMRKCGMDYGRALKTLEGWNASNKPPMGATELERVLMSAFSSEYDFGCYDAMLNSLCDKNCPLAKKQSREKGKQSREKGKQNTSVACFVKLPDRSLVEQVYRPNEDGPCAFAVYDSGNEEHVHYEHSLDTKTGLVLPYQPNKLMSGNRLVMLPTQTDEYGTDQQLTSAIDTFVRRYLAVSDCFHAIIPYYVKMTWLYDRFPSLP